jgi:hypothetical protein
MFSLSQDYRHFAIQQPKISVKRTARSSPHFIFHLHERTSELFSLSSTDDGLCVCNCLNLWWCNTTKNQLLPLDINPVLRHPRPNVQSECSPPFSPMSQGNFPLCLSKVVRVHSLKSIRESEGIAPLILNLDTTRR